MGRLLLVLLLLVACQSLAAPCLDFAAPRTVGPALIGAASVSAGDFNGDGLPDLAVAQMAFPGTLQVLINQGSSFQTNRLYTIGDGANCIATADFNGDHRLDVAITCVFSDQLYVLMGLGDGAFAPARIYATRRSPSFVTAADLNEDGHTDLIVANADFANVSVFLGHGDGTFAAAVDYPADATPLGIAVADFDGDGHLDLLVANNGSPGQNYNFVDGKLSLLRGKGDGTFRATTNLSVPFHPVAVTTGDFNRDGRADLGFIFSDGLTVLLGHGDGSFGTNVNYATGRAPVALAMNDFDGDLIPDLVVASSTNLAVYRGLGDGAFRPPVVIPRNAPAQSVAAIDLNADGNIDIIEGEQSGGNVWVLTSTCVARPVKLSIARSKNTISVSWPSSATGFTLENATDFLAGPWQINSVPPHLAADQWMVAITHSPPRSFYRLRKP